MSIDDYRPPAREELKEPKGHQHKKVLDKENLHPNKC